MDIEQARFNMIEQQIRPWDVLHPRVLKALTQLAREDFVPARYRDMGFADIGIRLPGGEVMMQPKVEARLVQELMLEPDHKVLEIGTGSGFVTALLAQLAAHVTSIEIRPELSSRASENLTAHNIGNVMLEVGDGIGGWTANAPYDAILLTGSVAALPQAFKQQLAPGGRIVAIIGKEPIMEAMMWNRVGANTWNQVSLFDTTIPPLKNGEPKAEFIF
ncbi:MAG: protein-L-isoaspartate O-methyltransferase family protein [Arenicellales bacterium WSBS_2016_MAG_OTU3]